MFLLITGTVVTLTAILWAAGLDTFRKSDVIFGFAALLLFQAIALGQLVQGLQILALTMARWWIGTATAKHKELYPNKRVKGYRITAHTGTETFDAVCLKQTFARLQKGDRLLMFSAGSATIYGVHLDN